MILILKYKSSFKFVKQVAKYKSTTDDKFNSEYCIFYAWIFPTLLLPCKDRKHQNIRSSINESRYWSEHTFFPGIRRCFH